MTNIAILGAGGIAVKMSQTLQGMVKRQPDSLCMYAVASRSLEKARRMAEEYGYQKAYGSYEEMLEDQRVELVYVASPHSHHCQHVKLCLEHGKHVLCEKAFTVNAAQAREICALAREKGLLLAEAIWTRYMPSRRIIQDYLDSGALGKPKMLMANLCYALEHVERIRDPRLAGGALLDLGVYPLNFAAMVLGQDISAMTSTVEFLPTGVDRQESITLQYPGGELACLCASASGYGDRRGMVMCEKGYLAVDNINNPLVITVQQNPREGHPVETLPVPQQITGYEYEVEACLRAIRAGQTQCPEMPHEDTIRMMEWMDALRAQWGLRYPCE